MEILKSMGKEDRIMDVNEELTEQEIIEMYAQMEELISTLEK